MRPATPPGKPSLNLSSRSPAGPPVLVPMACVILCHKTDFKDQQSATAMYHYVTVVVFPSIEFTVLMSLIAGTYACVLNGMAGCLNYVLVW